MRVLKKNNSENNIVFDWLNFDYLPNSDGFKFEIYFDDKLDDLVAESILVFYLLFKSSSDNILIKPFGENSKWGDFCLDTWDIENDLYDYSTENKNEPSISYLKMLRENMIEPEYSGYCECNDWDKFLYITLNCVMRHIAPYSMMFYDFRNEFVFYFHHSGSIAIYYKDLNDVVQKILKKATEENMVVKK